MKVLSLFDGMSCGQIALRELGIIPDVYYASEIDTHAIRQTQLNFPDTVQLGDVTKWKGWDIDWENIDLLLAGSPCQGFSFAGKQLAFNDLRSKLFFVFVDILNHIKSLNPKVLFLLENVNMKKGHMRIISEHCGVFPVNINSNLVSAQNRNRWYWTNIRTRQDGLFGEVYSDIPQPEDRGIFLKDILETDVDEKYYISGKWLDHIRGYREEKKFTQINGEKALPAMARQYSDWNGDYVCAAMRGREEYCLTARRTEYGKAIRKDYEAGKIREKRANMQKLEPRNDEKTNCLTSVDKDNLILQLARGYNPGGIFEGKTPTLSACSWEQNNLLCERQNRNLKSESEKANIFLSTSWKVSQANGMTVKEVIQLNPSKDSGGVQPYQQDRVYCVNGISPALLTGMSSGTHAVMIDRIRRLTPTECARLQTIPSWYRWECSDTQIYKMLGNGWTVDVIVHILSFIKNNSKQESLRQ